MAAVRRSRSDRALVLSSGVALLPELPDVEPEPGPRPLVVDPVIDWYLLRSASLRLGVGRPLTASAAGLFLAGAPWLCAASESAALPAVAPPLVRRNTGIP